VSAQPLSEC